MLPMPNPTKPLDHLVPSYSVALRRQAWFPVPEPQTTVNLPPVLLRANDEALDMPMLRFFRALFAGSTDAWYVAENARALFANILDEAKVRVHTSRSISACTRMPAPVYIGGVCLDSAAVPLIAGSTGSGASCF